MKATAQQQRALTGEFFWPKPTGSLPSPRPTAATSRLVAIFSQTAEPRRQTVEKFYQAAEPDGQTAGRPGHLAEQFGQTAGRLAGLAEPLCQLAELLCQAHFPAEITPFPCS